MTAPIGEVRTASSRRAIAPIAIGVFLAVAGFFLLNYTNGFGVAHHAEWARTHSMPEPSVAMFYGGVASLAIGAFVVGRIVQRRRSP